MNSQLAKKLLVIATGVLFLLLAALYQMQGQSQKSNTQAEGQKTDIAPLLRNSILQQRRNFQRCWLMNADPAKTQQIWQLYLTVEPTGRVKHFELLNKAMFSDETEKCLRSTVMRLKFPVFSGDEISFTIPITVSSTNENH